MGVAVENSLVTSAANNIGYMTLSLPFSYLGVNVGGYMSRIASWDVVINKVLSRLSKWKMKVLSVGGRLALLKSVLGSTPIYYMSFFKALVQVINKLEAIRSHFFHGVDPSVRKMMLVKWNNVLASKEMKALHGEEGNLDSPTTAKFPSNWLYIIHSFSNLYNKGVDLLCSIKKKETESFLSVWLETILMIKFWERLALKSNGVSLSRLRSMVDFEYYCYHSSFGVFFCASALCINLQKGKLMGVAVENSLVTFAANNIGYMTLSLPFSYLGVNVGGHMSRIAYWDVVINKVLSRLSKWKMKVLSVGGRLTLLKSVLGLTPFQSAGLALHGEEINLDWPTTAKFPSNWSDIIRSFSNLYNKDAILEGVPSKSKMASLLSLLECIILPNMIDRWMWSISRDEEFYVSSVRNYNDDKILGTVSSKTQWCKFVPIKSSSKAILWVYISVLLSRWNGETIVMGDFNEVRSGEERRGSCFNPYSAKRSDRFILTSGLVDIKLEGYTFTWSHPSATKMNKLDHFLVSDGIYSLFPSITAICLDRHIFDHRPILLRDVKLDFRPTPFRFYNSWFDLVGFDDMIKAAWRSFSHSDKNAMIRFKKNFKI
nr:RNA-directed DNA polymerase, eukaryota [Tanacetum cinerariifolium]